MNSRFKLEEAQYFLTRLQDASVEPKVKYFYLSAFLAAWRSIVDVLFWDLAEYFGIGEFYINAPSQARTIDENYFECVALTTKNSQALELIKWFRTKKEEVGNNELSNMRRIDIHEGLERALKPQTIFVPVPMSESILRNYTSWKVYEEKMSTIIRKCEKGVSLVESIVNEAERKLKKP